MLRITQQTAPAAAKGYYSRADYLADGHELAGVWGGRGAAMLGLSGVVQKQDFDHLCDNQRPDGSPLTARTRADRTVGYDWTFNAPKSVSVLYGLTRDEEILSAFRDAVRETMQEAELETQTRVRKGLSESDRRTGSMVWAEFTHTTGRPVGGLPDPHLHAHCFVFNATFDSVEHAWKAAQFRDLKRDARYFEAGFHARLSKRLADLGYGIERTASGWEIAGVPARVLRDFSRRTAQIEEAAASRDITDPDEKAALGAKTREAKNPTLTMPELQSAWDARLSDADRERLMAVHGRSSATIEQPNRLREGVEFALSHCFATTAVVPEKQLVAEALRRGVGAVLPADVRRELERQGVILRERDGRLLATTSAVLRLEQQVIGFARAGRGTRRPITASPHAFKREKLNPGQRAAVEHVLHSTDRVTLINGAAGTGKTWLMKEAVEAINDAGKQVVVLAPSADASRGVLRGEGFSDATTVAGFLKDRDLQEKARGGVIWVDEAGLLTLGQADELFGRAAELDARIVCSGDRRQHTSVERGDFLKLLEDQAGLPKAEVTEIRRQQHDGYRRAVEAFAEGRAAEGLARLDQLGWLVEIPDAGERYRRIADEYSQGLAENKSVLVVSPTHAEAEEATQAIRRRLKTDGVLGKEQEVHVWQPVSLTEAQRGDPLSYLSGDMLQFHTPAIGHRAGERVMVREGEPIPVEHAGRFEVFRSREISLAVGDRVRITSNGWTKDRKHRLNRGGLYSVSELTPGGDVRFDNGWLVARDFGHIGLGYVLTSHASQGKTVDRVIVAQSTRSFPASSPEQAYVSASRARERVTVYSDDLAGLRQSVERHSPRLSATELVRQPISRQPRRGRFAHLRRLASAARDRVREFVKEQGRDHDRG